MLIVVLVITQIWQTLTHQFASKLEIDDDSNQFMQKQKLFVQGSDIYPC